MDIVQLTRFAEAGRCLSFTKAAEALFITQPTLSHTISQMEKELGTPLFYRVKKTVKLTPAGEAFLPYAIEIVNRYENAMDSLREQINGTNRVLSIGVFGVGLNNGISHYIRCFQAEHPETKISIRRYSTNEFASIYQASVHDIFLMYDLNIGFTDFHAETLYSERFELLLNSEHPLSEAKQVDLKNMAGEPLLLRSRTLSAFYHDKVLSICNARGCQPIIIDVNGSYGMIHRMVGEGHGMAILSHTPSSSKVSDVHSVKYVCIDEQDDLNNDVLFAWRGKLSKSGEEFLRITKENPI